MMNKKGVGVFEILVLFIGVVFVLALLPQIFSSQAQMTQTYSATNVTYTPAAAGSSVDLVGQELFGTPRVINQSGATIDCSNNVTIAEGVSPRTGTKRVLMTSDTLISSVYCSSLNVSYDYALEGYVDDSGGRGVAGLMGLFAVIALLGFVVWKSEILG